MRRFTFLGLVGLCLLLSATSLFAQRKMVDVPKVDPAAITIDGRDNEGVWANAAKADVVTPTSFEGWFNYYGRPAEEPEYQELWSRMLWAKDTLYLFFHMKEIVNDSSGLFWDPGNRWDSDQLFIGLSSRLGVPMDKNYAGMVYAAPEGPYHFLVLGPRVTLNDSGETWIPEEWRKFPNDTTRVFNAHDIAHSATFIDTANGVWNVEMAIYNPNIAADSKIGFNFGGSQSSRNNAYRAENGDAYQYWAWQPSVADSPFAVPNAVLSDTLLPADPGGHMLINSDLWALLSFDVRDVVNGVSDETALGGVPQTYVLSQNYPNPFNPSTKIVYAIPHSGKVALKVYNVLGQLVNTLVNDVRQAGTYEVQWNASQLATGVYLYQLVVDNRIVQTKKMLLLK